MSAPEDEFLQTQLEQVTARDAPTPPLGGSTGDDAALRESWLALGRLLESADRDFDEAALLARLQGEAERLPASRRGAWGWGIGIAALAASLLAAAALWRVATNDRAPLARDELAAKPHVPAVEPLLPHALESSPRGVKPAEPAAAHYAWDDSLDDRLAEMDQWLTSARCEWRGQDAPYAALDDQLQELSESLGNDPL